MKEKKTSVVGPFELITTQITDCSDAGNKEKLALRKCMAHASIH